MNEYIRIDARLLRCTALTPTDKIVFAYLRFRQGGNSFAWPGVGTIARDCALAKNTVRDSIRRLENAGLLEVERDERGGSGKTHHYITKDLSAWLESQATNGSELEPFTGDDNGSGLAPFFAPNGSESVRQRFRTCTEKGSELEPEKRSLPKGKIPKRISCSVQLGIFWDWYPEVRRGDRAQAINAWNAALAGTDEPKRLAGAILEGLHHWRRSTDWQQEEYIPFAGAFIASHKWEQQPKNFQSCRGAICAQ